MACRAAFVVVLMWALAVSTDAAQVARDINLRPKQALRKKSIPVEDQNLLDDTLLSALKPIDSSKGKPGDDHQIKNLLRLVSGTDRLDPAAFDGLFEQLRTSTKTTLNTSVQGIESDYNGHVADITACQTNHGFHGTPANARRIAYDAAEQAYKDAVQVAEQKCSTQTDNCNDQRTKAMALHNYVQTEIVNTYGCTQASVQCPPTVFGPTDFYLRDTDDVAAAVKEKHGAWETAAGKCSAATGECNDANENTNDKCEDVDGVAVNGRSDYDQCYGQHQGILNGFQLDTLIANQKTVVRQLEKVLCIIKVAVDSHGDTPKRDSVMTCTDLGVDLSPTGGVIEYKCVCTSPSSTPPEIYSETYVTQLTLDPEPSRDTAWDALGCANSVISTTAEPNYSYAKYIRSKPYWNSACQASGSEGNCGDESVTEEACAAMGRSACDKDPQCGAFMVRIEGKDEYGSTYRTWPKSCNYTVLESQRYWNLYQKQPSLLSTSS